jgi:outer membrane protein assembly factor BamB
LIYIPFRAIGVVALHLSASSTSTAWRSLAFRSGPPIVAGSAVWAIDLGHHRLYALNRNNGHVRFQRQVPAPAQFSTPTAADGRIYMAAGTRVLMLAER